MAKTNVKIPSTPIYTHEGARAKTITAEQMLRRSVCSCLLWEDEFYEDGQSIVKRIQSLIPTIPAEKVAKLAIEARAEFKLRHMPLLLTREMARHKTHKPFVADTLSTVIQRADELAEFLSIYWSEGKTPIAAQVKKGLAGAFRKFDEYALGKYNRDGAIKLRDVLFLCHPKPLCREQAELWKKLAEGTIATPDTWEVNLSAGKDKKETFERLMREKKLGGLALLRNLRNMEQAGCDSKLIRDSIRDMKVDRILPFRFIAAANHAHKLEDVLEPAMLKCMEGMDRLPGKTKILVDVSGSMDAPVSHAGGRRSEISRLDAACGIAMLGRELCEQAEIYTFSNRVVSVPPRRGFALKEAIVKSQSHGGTELGRAVQEMGKDYDRLIVFTDEQSHDRVPDPHGRAYMVNVASNRNGVGYGKWNHIDGFSEATIKWIGEFEKRF